MTTRGDVVPISYREKPSFFARTDSIETDIKKDEWDSADTRDGAAKKVAAKVIPFVKSKKEDMEGT